jgi:hypothetical protein
MKLHRLVLTNYRGVTHREIEFPDRGVVIVSGANEIGKSSMIEALDLLLEAKDRSSKKEVKQVKPTHADVGAEITAEISTGPYRFVYRKRFHKGCETQLTVSAPAREQLTGDEAHDRVRAMLEETIDSSLWEAQRVLQSTATAAVDLSGCDALSRALDVAAGEAVELSGAEPLLVDRVEAEYARYFTRTGRPTGEWGAANNRLSAAETEVARCAAAVAEVDEAVRRHATLTDDLAALTAELATATTRLTSARTAADNVEVLTQQVKQAEQVAATAQARHVASAQEVATRQQLRADIDKRATAIAEHQTAAGAAAEELAEATEVQKAAETAAEAARIAVETGRTRVEAARRVVDQLADRVEADRLSGRLAKIVAAQRELERVDAEAAGIAMTDEAMSAIEAAKAAVDIAAGQVELMAARIDLIAVADVEVRVAGEPVVLEAGQTWSGSVSAETAVEVPGLLTVRVAPGASASDTRANLVAAEEMLQAALTAAGVADVDAARSLDQQRRQLAATRDRLRATTEALVGDEPPEWLRARLAELTQHAATDVVDTDSAIARTELDAAETALRQAIADCETHRKVAEAAAKKLGEKEIRAAATREKLTIAQAELVNAQDRLTAARTATPDDALAEQAAAHEEEVRRADALVVELGAELACAAPETVAAELDAAERQAEKLGAGRDDAVEARREVSAALKVYGTEGRRGQLDIAKTEREHAAAEHLQVRRRARAAEMLRSVLARHRDATRRRYVDPFRSEVERLGRIVFGDSFEVEVDSALRICSRTLAGRTVPYDSLSGGAKEQLGIVARLASAALVDKQDAVPVVIDDALGFTDPDRLVKMGAVFNAVGGDGQVIVLTCSPQRYAGVAGAHQIELVV